MPMLKAERISCSGPKLSDAQTRNFEAIKHTATLGHLERGKRRSTKLERRYYELLCELERALPQTAS